MFEVNTDTRLTVGSQITLGIGIHEILLCSRSSIRSKVRQFLLAADKIENTGSTRRSRSIAVEMQVPLYWPEELTSIRSPGITLIGIEHLVHVIGLVSLERGNIKLTEIFNISLDGTRRRMSYTRINLNGLVREIFPNNVLILRTGSSQQH